MTEPTILQPPVQIRLEALTTSSVRVDGIGVDDLREILDRHPRLDVAPRETAPEDDVLATLTERERDVLSLIATGLSNTDVGRSMYLSINTIKSYVRSTYRKIGVETRSQAVRWALDHGLGTKPLTALHDLD